MKSLLWFLTVVELRRSRFYLVSLLALLLVSFVFLRAGDQGEWGVESLKSVVAKIKAGERQLDEDDGRAIRYAFAGLLQLIVFCSMLFSGLTLLVTYMMRNRADVDSGNIFLYLTSPHRYLFLHLHKFLFCFVGCIFYSGSLVVIFYYFLPETITDTAGSGKFLFIYTSYILCSLLLPFFAFFYLLANINLAYHSPSRSLLFLQYLGVYALAVYVIPQWLWPLFKKTGGELGSLALPKLEFIDGFVLNEELAIEPLIFSCLVSALFIYLATRIWQELEV